MVIASIRDVPQDRLRNALTNASACAMAQVAKYKVPPTGAFALSLFDLSGPAGLTPEDFVHTWRVLDAMSDRLVAHLGTDGYDEPKEGNRYAIWGRPNLSEFDMTSILAAELLVSEAETNLELLHTRAKRVGFCSSFGGRRFTVSTGPGNSDLWHLAIAGSGFSPEFAQRVADGAVAGVHHELVEAGVIPVKVIQSETFILEQPDTWRYPRS